MKTNYSSIKVKLLRIVLITSGFVLFLTCSTIFIYEYFSFRQSMKEQLSTLGEIIAANSTAALVFESPSDATETLQALKAQKHVVAAALYDSRGELFAKYTVSPKLRVPKYSGLIGYDYIKGNLEGFQPVVQRQNHVGTLYLRSDLEAIYSKSRLYALVAFIAITIAIFFAYLLSRRLQRSLSDPILSLAQSAAIVSKDRDYSVRAKKFYNDEIGELTEAFNQMLTRIEKQNAEIISFNRDLEIKVNERTNELEQANTELKLKNDFVETIFDSSIDVIGVFDIELNYVMLNKYAQQIYGVRSEQVIGKNILQVFPQIIESPMYKDLIRSLDGTVVHNAYYESYLSDNILELFYIPLLDKDGHVYSILLIGHDITQRIQAAEKLNTLNNELARSNRELEQFAYVASHDLQEPLRKIQTYASLMEKEMYDNPGVSRYLSNIISSAGRMRELINSILNYSQALSSNGKTEDVNLNEIIESIMIDYELSIREKNAEIEADQFPVIQGEKLQLNLLFLNLISNSLKFSKNKPEIHIRCLIVRGNDLAEEEGLANKGNYLKILFGDNGIGFDPQFSHKAFTIFQRFHSQKEYPGTGIGLALCKKIVENHKGTISVSSKPGVGSVFTIYLPITLARG